MFNALTDNLVVLKDTPSFWRKPSFTQAQLAFDNTVALSIFYSIMFGQESPTIAQNAITRVDLLTSSKTHNYFVGVFVPSRKQISGFSYPPVGTNTIDPVALLPAAVKNMSAISKEDFDLPFDEYESRIPEDLLQSLGETVADPVSKSLAEIIQSMRSRTGVIIK